MEEIKEGNIINKIKEITKDKNLKYYMSFDIRNYICKIKNINTITF